MKKNKGRKQRRRQRLAFDLKRFGELTKVCGKLEDGTPILLPNAFDSDFDRELCCLGIKDFVRPFYPSDAGLSPDVCSEEAVVPCVRVFEVMPGVRTRSVYFLTDAQVCEV